MVYVAPFLHVCVRMLLRNECALPCFVCVGRLIVCCGESAEGRSKARSHSPRGERMLRNPFAETENNSSEQANAIGGWGGGKITLDVRKSRE